VIPVAVSVAKFASEVGVRIDIIIFVKVLKSQNMKYVFAHKSENLLSNCIENLKIQKSNYQFCHFLLYSSL
jgi:hypothetical protein